MLDPKTINLNLSFFESFLRDSGILPDINSELFSNIKDSLQFTKSYSSISTFKFASRRLPSLRVNLSLHLSRKPYEGNLVPPASELLYSTKSVVDFNIKTYIERSLLDLNLGIDESLALKPKTNCLLVAGLNEPYFLPSLIDYAQKNNIKYLAFADSTIHSYISSSFVVDWEKIRSQLQSAGIKANFFLDSNLALALSSAVEWFSSFYYMGSINYYYYIDRIMNSHCSIANSLLKDDNAYINLIGKGFFEDNYNMVINSRLSQESNAPYIDFSKSFSDKPIVVVSSGPSLDSQIDEIKSLKSEFDCIIVASGSATTSLLERNILPDYAVLVERNESVYSKHIRATKYHSKFKQISLIAASTVDSRIFPLYKDVKLYVRSSNIFAKDFPKYVRLSNTHTTSSNAALSFSFQLDPPCIVVYGMDFGGPTRSNSRDKFAHGVGSYTLNKAIRGKIRTMFSNQELLRSASLISPGSFDRSRLICRSNMPDFVPFSFSDYNNLHSLLSSLDESASHAISTISLDSSLNVELSPFVDFIKTFSLDFESFKCPVTSLFKALCNKFGNEPSFKIVYPALASSTMIYSLVFTTLSFPSNEYQSRLLTSYRSLLLSLLDEFTLLFPN